MLMMLLSFTHPPPPLLLPAFDSHISYMTAAALITGTRHVTPWKREREREKTLSSFSIFTKYTVITHTDHKASNPQEGLTIAARRG